MPKRGLEDDPQTEALALQDIFDKTVKLAEDQLGKDAKPVKSEFNMWSRDATGRLVRGSGDGEAEMGGRRRRGGAKCTPAQRNAVRVAIIGILAAGGYFGAAPVAAGVTAATASSSDALAAAKDAIIAGATAALNFQCPTGASVGYLALEACGKYNDFLRWIASSTRSIVSSDAAWGALVASVGISAWSGVKKVVVTTKDAVVATPAAVGTFLSGSVTYFERLVDVICNQLGTGEEITAANVAKALKDVGIQTDSPSAMAVEGREPTAAERAAGAPAVGSPSQPTIPQMFKRGRAASEAAGKGAPGTGGRRKTKKVVRRPRRQTRRRRALKFIY